jgi:heme A synthase
LRLKPSFRFSIYAAFTVLFLTGAGWLVADWQKDISGDEIWQQTAAFLLMVHGGGAMVTLLLLGELIPTHIRRAWRTKKNRVSGSVVVTLNALLIVTAFGLYYLGSETVRPWMSWIHIAAGFSLALLIPAHIFLGRRGEDRGNAARSAQPPTDDPLPWKDLLALKQAHRDSKRHDGAG